MTRRKVILSVKHDTTTKKYSYEGVDNTGLREFIEAFKMLYHKDPAPAYLTAMNDVGLFYIPELDDFRPYSVCLEMNTSMFNAIPLNEAGARHLAKA